MKTYIVTVGGRKKFECIARHSIDAMLHAMIKYGHGHRISARLKVASHV